MFAATKAVIAAVLGKAWHVAADKAAALTYAGDPTNNLTPAYQYQFCIDTTNGRLYWASTALSSGWKVCGDLGLLSGVTAGTAIASKAVTLDANSRTTGIAGLTSSVAGLVAGFFPTAVDQAINANGAVVLTAYNTNITSVNSTGQAFTLADGSVIGHRKRIQLIVDGGDAVVTFNTDATLTFADVGDVAELIWTGTIWAPIALYNIVDGATAPAYSAAS